MSKTVLQFAGWIAAISAVLTVPLFVLQALVARGGPSLLSTTLQLVSVVLLLYVLTTLRGLLAQKQLVLAHGYLGAIIAVTIVLQLITLAAAPDQPVVATLLFVGLIALGILYIVVGIKLLAHAGALPGLKLFSYAAIAVGTCSASIVLALLALPASMVLDIALAIIFFREAGNAAPASAKPADAAGG